MILRMSKIDIVGPKQLLGDVIALLRELGIFQIEPSAIGFVEEGFTGEVHSFALDEKAVFERLFLEDLRQKIDRLFSLLPCLPVRESYIEPQAVVGTIAYTIERHIEACRKMRDQKDDLQRQLAELRRYSGFLSTMESLFAKSGKGPEVDFIGLTIRDPGALDHLRALLAKLTGGNYKIFTVEAGEGALGGLITVEKTVSDKVSRVLSSERIVEMAFPDSFDVLSLAGKISYLETQTAALTAEIGTVEDSLEQLCRRWRPIYANVRTWIDGQLSLLAASASAYETKMCFFIYGWMPAEDLPRLRTRLSAAFGDQVVVEEREVREEDFERVPVVLRNAPYFKPFELFTKVLPLPAYTSLDPTPFIGIFFPLFFGMILGDAGYGLLLGLVSLICLRRFAGRPFIRDASKIFLVSAGYAVFFGVLFGEFFGDLPHRLFGLKPLCVERREAVVPMLFFALAVGAAHILLGLVLGVLTALRKKTKKEAAFRALSILTILCLGVVLASYFGIFPAALSRPLILTILLVTPLLFLTGGLLAPLEILKSIGNIISYVRITAIGLTSVLLAFMANSIAGLMGNIALGIAIAAILHLLNIILGVFSPTIHALRLHYVEFFSKFFEHGGREFQPLRR